VNPRLERLLESRRTIWAACAFSLALGAFFLFVWSPLPWGWLGIDHYDDRALKLAAGEPFDTTDVPWGYAYYLAAFYRVFGHYPVVPLVGQVVLNALLPWLIFAIARPLVGTQTATLAALITGVCSFNTVYTSTQTTDAVCTMLFAAMMWSYLKGRATNRFGWFALAGGLAGIAAQFRPNLMLFPAVLAVVELLTALPFSRRVARACVFLACAGLALAPWIVRNHRLTGEFLPTSTHGGVQLWYGTLQVGPFIESRAHNPRSAFESPPFDYTVLVDRSVVITAKPQCRGRVPASASLVYWTDREQRPARVGPRELSGISALFEMPPQPAPTVVYYYLEASWPGVSGTQTTPDGGTTNPFVYFVSDEHLVDLDRRDDLLDVFDLVRLLRWEAWKESPRAPEKLDFAADGSLDRRDLEQVVAYLLDAAGETGHRTGKGIDSNVQSVTLRLEDGSWLRVPRAFSGKVTDLEAEGALAQKLLYSRRRFSDLAAAPASGNACTYFDDVAANEVFYRKEPHAMRRYTALAWDNIQRDPAGFAAAAAYRMLRLFIIRGTDDRHTSQQFAASRLVYAAGTVASAAYFMALLAGLIIALRRRMPVWPLILPIAYVPLTIAPVLTNMRYTLTAQPYAFVFIAIALVSVLKPSRR
jgi:Dolichyl-phosphate-mannose-protein mannosyltransferase